MLPEPGHDRCFFPEWTSANVFQFLFVNGLLPVVVDCLCLTVPVQPEFTYHSTVMFSRGGPRVTFSAAFPRKTSIIHSSTRTQPLHACLPFRPMLHLLTKDESAVL